MHLYPQGWLEENGTWQYIDEVTEGEMVLWRYCPSCGQILAKGETNEPECSGCHRVWEACPCACMLEDGHV